MGLHVNIKHNPGDHFIYLKHALVDFQHKYEFLNWTQGQIQDFFQGVATFYILHSGRDIFILSEKHALLFAIH